MLNGRLALSPFGLMLLLAGCGTGERSGDPDEDRGQVRQSLNRYFVGVRDGDGRAACGQMTPAGQKSVVRSFNASMASEPKFRKATECAAAIERYAATRTFLASTDPQEAEVQERGLQLGVDATSSVENVSLVNKGNRADVTVKGLPRNPTMRDVDGKWLVGPLGP